MSNAVLSAPRRGPVAPRVETTATTILADAEALSRSRMTAPSAWLNIARLRLSLHRHRLPSTKTFRADRHKLSHCRTARQPREKPKALNHSPLQSRAAVSICRSQSSQQETRRSVESFHLSACELSSRPSKSIPSSPARPLKREFTGKHLRTG